MDIVALAIGFGFCIIWLVHLQREISNLRIQNIYILEEMRAANRRESLQAPMRKKNEGDQRSMEDIRPHVGK